MRKPLLSFITILFLAGMSGGDGCSDGPTGPSGPSCTLSYCGSISMDIHMRVGCQGFGYQSSGTVTLTFSERPPDYTVYVRLNAMSISGHARTSGRTTVEVPISGSSIACPFTNPSDLVITDPDGYVLDTIRFNWTSSSRCPSCF